MHCTKVLFIELLDLFNNDFENNLENNAWNFEHETLEILNRIAIAKSCEHNYLRPTL